MHLVFIGVFAVVALPLVGSALAPSRSSRQALATLDSAIKAESQEVREQILNLRKNDQLSSIPWLNQQAAEIGTGAVSAQASEPGDAELEPGPAAGHERRAALLIPAYAALSAVTASS